MLICPRCGEQIRVPAQNIASEMAVLDEYSSTKKVGPRAHLKKPLPAEPRKRLSVQGWAIAVGAGLVLAISCCAGSGIILILNWKEPAEQVTAVELSDAIRAKDIHVVSWERTTGAGGAQKWVDVYLTSAEGYNPYTPVGNVRDPDYRVVFTLYNRNNVKICDEEETLPRIRAGEKVRMMLASAEMPKAKRIFIHLKRE